ncbi:hypothetical protein SNOG_05273 [Parastagonospora nodorum SN15]|uniref:Uncharacterized protein n=1 Tax=Phaeosphaeria nodorum (strain SN15 / ATCC MYA-4574 / FGSC 10173) TaxID=321614 RepID=Q0USJ1_PHANO|nr:hypothetical protein SNOG_05273 [Parastagonospora nodorum SN15]EAT87664.1 hypothetical protein SNOG_05273 [Parastagonospora nodorum SN15]
MVQPLARLEDCRAGVCTPFDSPCLAPVKFIQYPCDIPAYRGLVAQNRNCAVHGGGYGVDSWA